MLNEGLVGEFDNLQTRMIAGAGPRMAPPGSMSDPVLNLAIRNIDRSFGFVGLTEKIDDHSVMLFKAMGLDPVKIERRNVTNRMLIDENDENYKCIDWEKVRERHRFDAELYRIISARH